MFYYFIFFNCEFEILIEILYENMISKLLFDKVVIRGYILYVVWVELVKNLEEIFKELCYGESLKVGE